MPFDRDWHVPASGVVTGWRGKVPPAVMEELFWRVAGPLAGGGGADDGGPVLVLGGMPVCGIDPGRRTHDAVAEVVHFTSRTYEWVVEGDIKACLDPWSYCSFPHCAC
ncbi:MAG TPA: hypothetical protein VMV92_18005 [Streptosporangiaceae bacterium]|nr:hypothetical protein [Streptosporangiaceae bacterium]